MGPTSYTTPGRGSISCHAGSSGYQPLDHFAIMKTPKHAVSSPIPVASPQPISRRKALPAHNLLSAHVLAALKQGGFYLSISGQTPELMSSDEKIHVPLEALTFTQLEAVKNLAHDQYVRGMLEGSLELDTHRATLNFLSRQMQKADHLPAPQKAVGNRAARSPHRKPIRSRKSVPSAAKAA